MSRNRGKPKPKLRDLTREWATSEEREELTKLFNTNMPPVVAAILGQAIVEQELERHLRRRFPRSDEQVWNALTDDKGPLGTFANKILAGYALKIYGEEMRDNLNTIRMIRNAFAHAKKIISFDNPLIVKELRAIKLPEKRGSHHDYTTLIRDGFFDGKTSYVFLCLMISNRLTIQYANVLARKNNRLRRKIERAGLSPLVKMLQETEKAKSPKSPRQSSQVNQNDDPSRDSR